MIAAMAGSRQSSPGARDENFENCGVDLINPWTEWRKILLKSPKAAGKGLLTQDRALNNLANGERRA